MKITLISADGTVKDITHSVTNITLLHSRGCGPLPQYVWDALQAQIKVNRDTLRSAGEAVEEILGEQDEER